MVSPKGALPFCGPVTVEPLGGYQPNGDCPRVTWQMCMVRRPLTLEAHSALVLMTQSRAWHRCSFRGACSTASVQSTLRALRAKIWVSVLRPGYALRHRPEARLAWLKLVKFVVALTLRCAPSPGHAGAEPLGMDYTEQLGLACGHRVCRRVTRTYFAWWHGGAAIRWTSVGGCGQASRPVPEWPS